MSLTWTKKLIVVSLIQHT